MRNILVTLLLFKVRVDGIQAFFREMSGLFYTRIQLFLRKEKKPSLCSLYLISTNSKIIPNILKLFQTVTETTSSSLVSQITVLEINSLQMEKG